MGDRHIPIIDEDKLDDIITALQALSAPSGTDVAISPTGMHIVTEDDVQGAISELDTAVDSVNSSLTNYAKLKSFQIANGDITNGIDLTNYFTVDTGYKYLATTQVMGVGWIPPFPLFIDENTKKLWFQGTLVGGSNVYVKVVYLEIRDIS